MKELQSLFVGLVTCMFGLVCFGCCHTPPLPPVVNYSVGTGLGLGSLVHVHNTGQVEPLEIAAATGLTNLLGNRRYRGLISSSSSLAATISSLLLPRDTTALVAAGSTKQRVTFDVSLEDAEERILSLRDAIPFIESVESGIPEVLKRFDINTDRIYIVVGSIEARTIRMEFSAETKTDVGFFAKLRDLAKVESSVKLNERASTEIEMIFRDRKQALVSIRRVKWELLRANEVKAWTVEATQEEVDLIINPN